jgi:release factor glutamine methyltransferase
MKKFLNCRIDSSKHSFTPRDETEFWVEKAIKKIKNSGRPVTAAKLKILDVFSGTGCIGISILKVCPETARRVDFVDIWPEATEQIRINLALNKISENRCRIFQSNLFEKLKGQKYHFIFANPPYVALDRISEVQKEVLKKEPKVALFAGRDGLVIIRKFLKEVKDHLTSGGKIFLEFDPLQKKKIKEICDKEGLKVVFKKDQFGKIRWLEAK